MTYTGACSLVCTIFCQSSLFLRKLILDFLTIIFGTRSSTIPVFELSFFLFYICGYGLNAPLFWGLGEGERFMSVLGCGEPAIFELLLLKLFHIMC